MSDIPVIFVLLNEMIHGKCKTKIIDIQAVVNLFNEKSNIYQQYITISK